MAYRPPPGSASVPPGPTYTVRLPIPGHKPLWTYVFGAANVLVWLLMTAMGGSENVYVLVRFGAKVNTLIVAGEYWRLLTAMFLHIGLVHLLFNTYALLALGLEVERRFGRKRFLALYLLAGLAGSALSFVGNSAISAGASGAIFGLLGATIVYFSTYRDQFGTAGRRQLGNLLLIAGYNLVLGLVAPGIDNLGHLGGLLGGLALGWAYCPRYVVEGMPAPYGVQRVVDRFRPARAWAASLCALLLLSAVVHAGTLRWG